MSKETYIAAWITWFVREILYENEDYLLTCGRSKGFVDLQKHGISDDTGRRALKALVKGGYLLKRTEKGHNYCANILLVEPLLEFAAKQKRKYLEAYLQFLQGNKDKTVLKKLCREVCTECSSLTIKGIHIFCKKCPYIGWIHPKKNKELFTRKNCDYFSPIET